MKSIYLPVLLLTLILGGSLGVKAQQLSDLFNFSKTKEDSGMVYELAINPLKMPLKPPYRIVGAMVFGDKPYLNLYNYQKEPQLARLTETVMTITVDSEEAPDLKFELAINEKHPDSFMEGAVIPIKFSLFEKMANAKSVKISFGRFYYNLTKENIDSLHYLLEQVRKKGDTQM